MAALPGLSRWVAVRSGQDGRPGTRVRTLDEGLDDADNAQDGVRHVNLGFAAKWLICSVPDGHPGIFPGRKNKQLRLDRGILSTAAAWFARESEYGTQVFGRRHHSRKHSGCPPVRSIPVDLWRWLRTGCCSAGQSLGTPSSSIIGQAAPRRREWCSAVQPRAQRSRVWPKPNNAAAACTPREVRND
jgi:hypothetical protein